MQELNSLNLDRLRTLIREIVLEVLEQLYSDFPRRTTPARTGWEEQFQAANTDDPGLLSDHTWPATAWETTEWEW